MYSMTGIFFSTTFQNTFDIYLTFTSQVLQLDFMHNCELPGLIQTFRNLKVKGPAHTSKSKPQSHRSVTVLISQLFNSQKFHCFHFSTFPAKDQTLESLRGQVSSHLSSQPIEKQNKGRQIEAKISSSLTIIIQRGVWWISRLSF